MNIELRKQKLISWIGGLHDDQAVKRLEIMQKMSNAWQEDLTETEKTLIDAGLAAIEAGQVHLHHKVMEEAADYLKKVK